MPRAEIATTPPKTYEELIRLIHDRYQSMSRSHQAIALYLTQNPNEVAVQSVNAIGERCGIHASSFVRFAQALGYKGFKELQLLFQKRLSTAAPGFDARVQALEGELDEQADRSGTGLLRKLVIRDIATLQELLTRTSEDDLTRAAEILEKADTVYLAGQLRSSPVVDLLRYVLTMLGKRCVLLDACGGLSTHMAKTVTARDALVAVSFRFYAIEVVNIVEAAAGIGVPIIAISDSSLSPVAKNATILFAVPEHEYTFSRSLAAPMCLAQAIAMILASRLQPGTTSPRIPIVTKM